MEKFTEHREQFQALLPAIRQRLSEFTAVKPQDYFYELCFCLCTPQSKARNADKVVQELQRLDFFHVESDPAPILRNPAMYIRFHNVKAKRLLKARHDIHTIMPILTGNATPKEKREQLVASVDGLGWKEASHFLRNIGVRRLAIIDRHVLRNLVEFGVFSTMPSVSTKTRYYAVEEAFQSFAAENNIDPDELDFYFWYMQAGEIFK